MSFSGSGLQPGGSRSCVHPSSSLTTRDSGALPMRRGLARLGMGFAEGNLQLSLHQRLICPWLLCSEAVQGSGRCHTNGQSSLLTRAYRKPSVAQTNLAAPDTLTPSDKAAVNNTRQMWEQRRLEKDYDYVPEHKVRKAVSAIPAEDSLGRLPGGRSPSLAGLPAGTYRAVPAEVSPAPHHGQHAPPPRRYEPAVASSVSTGEVLPPERVGPGSSGHGSGYMACQGAGMTDGANGVDGHAVPQYGSFGGVAYASGLPRSAGGGANEFLHGLNNGLDAANGASFSPAHGYHTQGPGSAPAEAEGSSRLPSGRDWVRDPWETDIIEVAVEVVPPPPLHPDSQEPGLPGRGRSEEPPDPGVRALQVDDLDVPYIRCDEPRVPAGVLGWADFASTSGRGDAASGGGGSVVDGDGGVGLLGLLSGRRHPAGACGQRFADKFAFTDPFGGEGGGGGGHPTTLTGTALAPVSALAQEAGSSAVAVLSAEGASAHPDHGVGPVGIVPLDLNSQAAAGPPSPGVAMYPGAGSESGFSEGAGVGAEIASAAGTEATPWVDVGAASVGARAYGTSAAEAGAAPQADVAAAPKKRGRKKTKSPAPAEAEGAGPADPAGASTPPADAEAIAGPAPAAAAKKKKKIPKSSSAATADEAAGVAEAQVAVANASSDAAAEAAEAPVEVIAKAKKKTTKKKAGAAAAEVGGDEAAAEAGGTAALVQTVAPEAPPVALPGYLAEGLLPLEHPQPIHGVDLLWEAVPEQFAVKVPLMGEAPSDILVVNTPEVARNVVDMIMAHAKRPYNTKWDMPIVPCRYFACDTEVAFIDVSSETPVGHGAVLCFSIYGGDDLDFSTCAGYGSQLQSKSKFEPGQRKDRIWVDVWDEVDLGPDGRPIMDGRYVRLKEHHPILHEFKRFFEDPSVKKVWHNYGFDRHVLENMGICCRGFGGDTLHMARLSDASRRGRQNYSLENLTSDTTVMNSFSSVLKTKTSANRMRTGDMRRLGAAGPSGAAGSSPGDQREAAVAMFVEAKVSMKDLFGMVKLNKNGEPGKVPDLPPMHYLHTRPLFRPTWIHYSAQDAKATWQLREAMESRLRKEPWAMETELAKQLGYPDKRGEFMHLWHFYCAYWLDFGELLTEMERRGMMVNREHLRAAEEQAEKDRGEALKEFLEWAASKVPGARYMNVGSGVQIRMLLFPNYPGYATRAEAEAAKQKARMSNGGKAGAPTPADVAGPADSPATRVIKVLNPDYEKEVAEGKRPGRYMNVELHGIWGKGVPGRLTPEHVTSTGAAAVSMKALRGLAGKPGAARKELTKLLEEKAKRDAAAAAEAAAARAAAERTQILADDDDEALMKVVGAEDGGGEGEEEEQELPKEEDGGAFAEGPAPTVDDPARIQALEEEAKQKNLGRLYVACGGGEEGLRACVAVEALCELNAIDKLLSAFIRPLQSDGTSTTQYPDEVASGASGDGAGDRGRAMHRVHCSLNINTETGRLSARRPNLQNQPALEKDRYKVRKAFTADVHAGKTLVVADYGQLELRILAHMTNCKSMQEAFIMGGDFHSRTAVGMYDHIKKDIEEGGCYLEWDGEGEPDKPLVKDKYASERRKAKVLNFSIAYGKTAHGLANDFKTTVDDAQKTVDRWYADRPEVREWQERTKSAARQETKVRTLLGRTRPLPNIGATSFKLLGHSNRAAINTPIQGSAADVAAAAMVAIHKSKELRDTGFKLLMQIHDEVILEGPKENAEEAKRLVMKLMANPWAELAKHWNNPDPAVDRGIMLGETWYRWDRPPWGHIAGVWWHEEGGAEAEGAAGGDGAAAAGVGEGHHGGKKNKGPMPLLVELATDCNVADTWYEAK